MKIAVLYIALGRYSVFWKKFYKSAEKNFLPQAEKQYFLFTDNLKIPFKNKKNVKLIYHQKMGWPQDSLKRFHLFLENEKELSQFDYIFFMNANTLIKSLVGTEILPSAKNDGLVVTDHPGFYNKPNTLFPYERNLNSSAYIPMNKGTHYACGAFNGGETKAYLKLCKECAKIVDEDLRKNIIPIWHDESVLNKYLVDKNPLIMSVSYLYPEEKWLSLEWYKNNPFRKNIKILSVDKTHPKYGGRDYLRGNIRRKPFFIVHRNLKGKRILYFLGVPFFPLLKKD